MLRAVNSSLKENLIKRFSDLSLQQVRTTFILKRRNDIPLAKKGCQPAKYKRRHFIYDIIEDTNMRPAPKIDIILTKYVDRYGERGARLSLTHNVAHKRFLLPGLAVYASPENIKKFEAEGVRPKTYSSLYASVTMHDLMKTCLSVPLSMDNPWTLEKWHLKVAFRKSGICVPEYAIEMPAKEISGPNLEIENKEFYITVTINQTEKVKVRCRIHHITKDEDKALPTLPSFWNFPSEPLFPEDKETLEKFPKVYVASKASNY